MMAIRFMDKFLNSVTMYRLILYTLLVMSFFAVVMAFFAILPFNALWLALSAGILIASAKIGNWIFASLFKIPANVESAGITALILFFVMTPAYDPKSLLALAVVGVIAVASKYILAIRKKHIFNPAAAGVVIGTLAGFGASSWWISLTPMLPLVLIAGFLIVRKLRRFEMFFAFLAASIVSMVIFTASSGRLSENWITNIPFQAVAVWPLVFFGAFMLTEPLTTPPKRISRIFYGIIVGVFFGAPWSVGGFYFTSEMALMAGNLFSFAVSFKERMIIRFREKKEIARSIFEFVFESDKPLSHTSGQYLEWTLEHTHPDSRGNRRFFTVASSPTEKFLRIGVKIIDESSSFKKALNGLQNGDSLVAGQLAGDFTLPADSREKLVFIAGGIGITPFRSMIKYLIDRGEKRDIILFYACADASEFAYREIFEEGVGIGLKTVYVVTRSETVLPGWKGKIGFLDKETIESEVGDYKNRLYYLSGPEAMVGSYKKLLETIGVSGRRIKTDYFPGY